MKRIVFFILGVAVLSGCGKGKGNENPEPEQPGQAALVLPAKNEVCTQGEVISADQSTVTFKWVASANTQNYEISVKNLEDGSIITETTTNTQVNVRLKRNTPFSWFVTSKSSNISSSTKSEVWKFFNAGPGVTSYAPFPAELTFPKMNEIITAINGKVTLTWTGSDADNDVANYDIYFGDAALPALLNNGVTAQSLEVNVQTGKTYFWKVITYDKKGNTSTSDEYRFTVK